MPAIGIALTVGMTLAGAVVAAVGLSKYRRPALDVGQYLHDLDAHMEVPSEYEQKLQEPFALRLLRPMGNVFGSLARLTPGNYLDTVHKMLLHAGLSGTIRAEEFVVAQAAVTGLSTLVAVGYVVLGSPSPGRGLLILILLPIVGLLLPYSWLTRKVSERKGAVLRDLPDTLDLLAISVEAGMGFEGALEVVCRHFHSPLAEEFSRTLREMELGLPRRDAFQNLKRRTEVPELSNFVLALMQADALGIPIGRVLKTQAVEMRNKRRQWAREKAAKLPVKMLFPLMLFIFPAILVIVMGPAASSFVTALK